MFRLLKCSLVLLVGLHALLYGLQNIANLSQALGAVAYVVSNTGHEIYPNTLFFPITVDALHGCLLAMIIAGELAIGALGIKGAWDMFRARHASAAEFNSAKIAGAWAAGLALLVWFGLFMTFGGALFQMWQTQAGLGSLEGAFMYAVVSVAVILFVYGTPDE